MGSLARRVRAEFLCRRRHQLTTLPIWVDYIGGAWLLPVTTTVSRRQVLERCKHLRDDHLRYMQKWGLIRPAQRTSGEASYAFADVTVIRQADAELAGGASFRAVHARPAGLADRAAGVRFPFRGPAGQGAAAEAAGAAAARGADGSPLPRLGPSSAEREFVDGVVARRWRSGSPSRRRCSGYRRALEIDPDLVPAIINLANIHYSRNEIAEAQALYERAIALEPEVFEAHFNLGNIFHDLARYAEARTCYRDALQLNPTYADAHFYLAVTLEKNGQSQEARLHWKAYQELAPNGEWVHLAKEFSD